MKTQRRLLSAAVLAITVGGLVYYAVTNWGDFENLTLASPIFIVPTIPLLLLRYLMIGLTTRELMRPLGLKLGVAEATALSIMTGFYNVVLPFRGGVATKAVYLKTRYGFSYTNSLATLSASYILTLLISSLLGLATLLLTYSSTGFASGVLLLAFGGIFVGLVFVVLFSPKIPETRFGWINRGVHVINAWDVIKQNRRLILVTSVLTLLQALALSADTLLLFKVFGVAVPFGKCIFMDSVGSLAQLIQVTPAGLGVNEALLVFSTQAIAVLPADALAMALLGRAVGFAVLAAAGPLTANLLLRNAMLVERAE
jgi:uncharacterized membrane protein YbhN (UPF0104 family)